MAFSKVLDVNIMYISTNRKQAVYNQLNIFIVHRHHHVMLLISRYLIVRIMYVVYNKSLEKVRVCMIADYHQTSNIFMIADYHQTSNICMIADYYQTCNIRCTLVGNKLVDHSNVFGASLLQLHLHSRLITWLQRQLQNEMKIIQVLLFGASYIRDFTVFITWWQNWYLFDDKHRPYTTIFTFLVVNLSAQPSLTIFGNEYKNGLKRLVWHDLRFIHIGLKHFGQKWYW